jgi:hypothetical protein
VIRKQVRVVGGPPRLLLGPPLRSPMAPCSCLVSLSLEADLVHQAISKGDDANRRCKPGNPCLRGVKFQSLKNSRLQRPPSIGPAPPRAAPPSATLPSCLTENSVGASLLRPRLLRLELALHASWWPRHLRLSQGSASAR